MWRRISVGFGAVWLLRVELLGNHVLNDFEPLLHLLFVLGLQEDRLIGRNQLETKSSLGVCRGPHRTQQQLLQRDLSFVGFVLRSHHLFW